MNYTFRNTWLGDNGYLKEWLAVPWDALMPYQSALIPRSSSISNSSFLLMHTLAGGR